MTGRRLGAGLLDQRGAEHLLQGGVERAVGQHPAPAEHQVEPLAQLVAVHGRLVQQSEDCQLEWSRHDVPCDPIVAIYPSERIAEYRSDSGWSPGRSSSGSCARAYPVACPGAVPPRTGGGALRDVGPERLPPTRSEPHLEWKAPGHRPRSEARPPSGRSDGTKAPAAASRKSAASDRSVLAAGLASLLIGVGAFVYLYKHDRHPEPEQGLRDPDHRSSTTPTARPSSAVRHPEPRVDPARRDAAEHAGRRRRRREPDLLDRPGHRPEGHPARGVQQRPAATPPRARRRSPSST